MLGATKDKKLVTAVTGSFPRPSWFTHNLQGRPFRVAMGDTAYREQYLDALACFIGEQERAGLDVLTDGDARFDLEVAGRPWFSYTLQRIGSIEEVSSTSAFVGFPGVRPGRILYEVSEAYNTFVVKGPISRGPLEYAAIWKTAQKMSERPIKFGTISATCVTAVVKNRHYRDEHELILELAAIQNEELKELAEAGCPVIQIEEPRHHYLCIADRPASEKELEFHTRAINREVAGVKSEIWIHTCWGNPNQQSIGWERPSYERALPYLLELDADVITLECASSAGRDLPLLGRYRTNKKIGIGVVSHTQMNVEPPELVAGLIRKALEYVPPERLIITSDCGFGRKGLSRRIAHYKCVSLVKGTNIVRRELGLPEVPIRAADLKFAL